MTASKPRKEIAEEREVFFRLCANTDPQRDSLFTKGPSDVLDHATSEIASGSKLGHSRDEATARRGLQTPLATAHQDGCGGAQGD